MIVESLSIRRRLVILRRLAGPPLVCVSGCNELGSAMAGSPLEYCGVLCIGLLASQHILGQRSITYLCYGFNGVSCQRGLAPDGFRELFVLRRSHARGALWRIRFFGI